MIELAQHIETLLLENDCVIVPGFGGFVAHYSPATRVKEENIFLPPTRTIGFNPQLKLNDGVLVQSYMSAYDTSFADAEVSTYSVRKSNLRYNHFFCFSSSKLFNAKVVGWRTEESIYSFSEGISSMPSIIKITK